MRIDRMLSIVVMLLNRNRISARELSEKFEVSIRTIYRDIDAINLAGIPIISYSGNNGGFGIIENYKIDHQLLTFNDMCTILSTLKGVNTTFEDRELDAAIEKIKSLVPRDKTDNLDLYLQQIVIDILPWGYTKAQKERIKTIQKSIINNNLLKFNYKNTKGEDSIREIEPITLVFKGYAWYLFSYCCLKNDYRVFRLSRMKNIIILKETFIRKNISYQDYMKYDITDDRIVPIILKFSPDVRVRVEDYFEEEEIEYKKDGEMIVKISYPEDQWVYSFILSFGENVEVIKPEHIRNIIQEKAKKIIKNYNPDIMLSHEESKIK